MSKLSRFRARVMANGQEITIYPFVAHPSGAYIDANSGYPDPDDANYPATIPEPTYGTAVTTKAFVQPVQTQDGGERLVKTVWGDEVQVALVAYVPGDQAIGHRDKVVVDSDTYWVAGIEEYKDKSTSVLRHVDLTESIPS